MRIFVYHHHQQMGPFTEAELRALLTTGAVSPDDPVWWEGGQTWIPLRQSPFASAPLPVPGVPPIPTVTSIPPTPGAMGPTSLLAIWSLICAGLSFFLCCILLSIPAIILGHMGLGEIKRKPGLQGRGMALAGTILGYVATGLIILVAICFLLQQALGWQVKDVFKTIEVQVPGGEQNSNSSDQTNSASSTNDAPATTNSAPDSPSPANE